MKSFIRARVMRCPSSLFLFSAAGAVYLAACGPSEPRIHTVFSAPPWPREAFQLNGEAAMNENSVSLTPLLHVWQRGTLMLKERIPVGDDFEVRLRFQRLGAFGLDREHHAIIRYNARAAQLTVHLDGAAEPAVQAAVVLPLILDSPEAWVGAGGSSLPDGQGTLGSGTELTAFIVNAIQTRR